MSSKTKILVIESDVHLLQSICDMLEIEGYDVLQAENGATGIQQAKDSLPTIILCCATLPDKTVLEVVEALKNSPETATIHVIVMTTRFEKQQFNKEYSILLKPFSSDELLSVIQASIRRETRFVENRRDETSLSPNQILFSAHYASFMQPTEWKPLYAYVFKRSASANVHADAALLEANLGQSVQMAKTLIPEGAQITAIPTIQGFQFNPISMTIGFYEDWHRMDFKMRAQNSVVDDFAVGTLTFLVEGVIVADIVLSVFVGEAASSLDTSLPVKTPYDRIFCSYSHRDELVIQRVEAVCKVLGHDYLRDIYVLKSGEHWDSRLLELIEQADVFQLFWSKFAAESYYVEKEWRYALSLKDKPANFIRPTYWVKPIHAPPSELEKLHFAYLELPEFLSKTPPTTNVLSTANAEAATVPEVNFLGVANNSSVSKLVVCLISRDIGMVTLAGIMLEREGYEVLQTRETETALDMLEVRKCDLIILDLALPLDQAESFCHTVRQQTTTKTVPILTLISRNNPQMAVEVLGFGANDYLLKPILQYDLATKVKLMLSRKVE